MFSENVRPNIVAFLVEQWKGSLSDPNERGELPLHSAILSSAPPEVIRYLAQQCPESPIVWMPGKISNCQVLHGTVLTTILEGI